MVKTSDHMCSASTWGGWHYSDCGNKGKYFEDDKWWCHHHVPSKLAAKKAKWEAEFQRGRKRFDLRCALDDAKDEVFRHAVLSASLLDEHDPLGAAVRVYLDAKVRLEAHDAEK